MEKYPNWGDYFLANSIEATECDKNMMVVQMTIDKAKVAQSANLGLYFECFDNIQYNVTYNVGDLDGIRMN